MINSITNDTLDKIYKEAASTFTDYETMIAISLGRQWFDKMFLKIIDELPIALLTIPEGCLLDGVYIDSHGVLVFDTNLSSSTYRRYFYSIPNGWTAVPIPCKLINRIYIWLNDRNLIMDIIRQHMEP